MSTKTNLKILTLIFHFCTVVGAGHGIGILGLLEVHLFVQFFSGRFGFQAATSEVWLTVLTLLAIIGQLCVAVSFRSNGILGSRLSIAGCLMMLLSTIVLAIESDAYLLVLFSVPFIFVGLSLLFMEITAVRSGAEKRNG